MGPTEMCRETVERFEVAEDVREWQTVASTQWLSLSISAGVPPTSEVRVAFMLLTENETVQWPQQRKTADMHFLPNFMLIFF